jgi:hypothetical protein
MGQQTRRCALCGERIADYERICAPLGQRGLAHAAGTGAPTKRLRATPLWHFGCSGRARALSPPLTA